MVKSKGRGELSLVSTHKGAVPKAPLPEYLLHIGSRASTIDLGARSTQPLTHVDCQKSGLALPRTSKST